MFTVGQLYRRLQNRTSWPLPFLGYLVGLLALEYVGFYLLGNQFTGNLPSYLRLGVLHETPAIHVTYTLAGPAYVFLLRYLRLV